jgi:hypothetical protein
VHFRLLHPGYAESVKVRLAVPLLVVLAVSASAQESGKQLSRFEDYRFCATVSIMFLWALSWLIGVIH